MMHGFLGKILKLSVYGNDNTGGEPRFCEEHLDRLFARRGTLLRC